MLVVMDIVSSTFAIYFQVLTHASRLLVRHPTVLERLRNEIQSVAGNDSNLTREDLKKMTYLANILKESMYGCKDQQSKF